MRYSLLIVNENENNIYKDFFEENAITEVALLKARSAKKSFFANLFNFSDIPKTLFIFSAKDTQLKELENLCEKTRNNEFLIKIKKERDFMENIFKGNKSKSLVVAIINTGFSEVVIDVAKGFEVSGATILNAKGLSSGHSSFMGMGIDSEREVVLIACDSKISKKLQTEIKKAILKNPQLDGICLSLPLESFTKFSEK